MARTEIRVAQLIHAPPAAVAGLCCDFRTLHEWHPAFASCEVEGEGPGAVRTLAMGGTSVRERLERVAEDHLGYDYSVLSYFIPVESVRGSLSVRAGEDEGWSILEWALSFEPGGPIPEQAVAKTLEATCRAGTVAARTRLEQTPPMS